jgi:predicted CXXCH cytochrome family protein
VLDRRVLAFWLVAASALFGLAWHARSVERELATARDLHGTRHVTAQQCVRCHAQRNASFTRTFHRTMTQEASAASVRAPFAGETLDYFGVTARMTRSPTGAFLIEYGGGEIEQRRFEVVLTVGSRRYQQYIARVSDVLVRLPVAFHLEEQRWFHMNGAFLTADPPLPLPLADYERHITRWNDNCVFCHNVAPNPGKQRGVLGARFDTRVAEHGIACEACHGPGEEHVARNTSPLRRYRLHLTGDADPTIVSPSRLSPERAADLCGRCHGQRITDDVERFLRQGDPFVPGDDLSLYSAPLWRDTTLAGAEGVFATRFWPDGTPRLTAYEYQGMLLSRCHTQGQLTCIDCHSMHAGDPKGQVRPDRQGDRMCTACHDTFATRAQATQHARHDLSDGSPRCVDCHMPPIVYGVLAAHPSHRIDVPNPEKSGALDVPDACTSCHVERTRAWASRERARLWNHPAEGAAPAPEALSEVERALFAGDPIVRALSAHSLGAPARARGPRRALELALLLDVIEHDPYPAVRRFARNAARSLAAQVAPALVPSLAELVPESPPEPRATWATQARARFPQAPALDQALLARLRAQAAEVAIDIGE